MISARMVYNNSLHCRIGFESFVPLRSFLRCCKAYHVDIGLHDIIVLNEFTGYAVYLCVTDLVSNYPKDPAVLKILCRSKFARRSKFAIA